MRMGSRLMTAFVLAAVFGGLSPRQAALADAASAHIDDPVLPADGRQATVLHIPSPGRYAITAQSDQGTALQLNDRMTGPGSLVGQPGGEDGRLDGLFDDRDYQLITWPAQDASGDVRLAVHTFEELHPDAVPALIEHRLVKTTLDDFQQRSYWVVVPERGWVALEAAGRNLSDLRLWRGGWLVDALPQALVSDADPERPLRHRRLRVWLERGFYRLTAYGGPAQPWPTDSDDHPLYLRSGTPSLGEAGRQREVISPFGIDRWVLPGTVTTVRLGLPEAVPATLTLDGFREDDPFSAGGQQAVIDKDSRLPVAEIHTGSTNTPRLVTVHGRPGQAFSLQYLEARERFSVPRDGRYWVSTLSTGNAADSIDATALLTRTRRSSNRPELQAQDTWRLDRGHGYRRRFNLLEPVSVFLEVATTTDVQVSSHANDAIGRFRIEPFLLQRPNTYQTPPAYPASHVWTLDPGVYVLGIEPERPGILDLTVAPPGVTVAAETPPRADSRFAAQTLAAGDTYTVHGNRRPGVQAGVIVRPLPLDLRQALPLTLAPGETLTLPFRSTQAERLLLEVDGERQPTLTVDDLPWQTDLPLVAGLHSLSLHNPFADSLDVGLRTASDPPPVPELAMTVLEASAEAPALATGTPLFMDLERQASADLKPQVDAPGLYRITTSGLLATRAALRTRTTPAVPANLEAGSGRNVLLQTYLDPADYRLQVGAVGETRGHLGVHLDYTPLTEAGELAGGVPTRASRAAGEALAYTLAIKDAGPYRLQAQGVDRVFTMRLEDADGWPLIEPGADADRELELQAGTYRLIVLPTAVDTRVVTRLEPVPPPLSFDGHGPHAIALDTTVEHLWLEPEDSQPRQPDQWTVHLPADAQVHIDLSEGMVARLLDADAAAVGPPIQSPGWSGPLPAGVYRLEVTAATRNNRLAYTLAVTTDALTVGQSRTIDVPAELPLSVGAEGLVEIESRGTTDVRARLLDADGRVLADNDDRIHDWNLHIVRDLPAGRYRLVVDALAGEGTTTIHMNRQVLRQEPEPALPARLTLADDSSRVIPLPTVADDTALVIRTEPAQVVGLALETSDGAGWRPIAERQGDAAPIVVPAGGPPMRLRTWPLSGVRDPVDVHITAAAVTGASADELLGDGVILTGADDGLGLIAIDLPPTTLRLTGGDTLQWSGHPGSALVAADSPAAVTGGRLWLAGEAGTRVTARPLVAGEQPQRLHLPADGPVTVGTPTNPADAALLVMARSPTAPVLVSLGDTLPTSAQATVAGTLAVAATLADGVHHAAVWSTGEPGDVDVHARSIPITAASWSGERLHSGHLAPATGQRLDLGGGTKPITLTLPAGSAALLADGEDLQRVLWADEPTTLRLNTDARELTVLYTGMTPAPYRVAVAGEASWPALNPGRVWQTRVDGSATLIVPVTRPAGEGPWRIRLAGEATATLLDDQGRLHSGELPVDGNGVLLIDAEPGLLAMWLESARRPLPRDAIRATPPSTVRMNGVAQSLGLALPQTTLLTLDSRARLITRFQHANGMDRIDLHPAGTHQAVLLPAGETVLTLHGLGVDALYGHLNLDSVAAIPLADGAGPEHLLPPGGRQLYTFTMPHSGPIGIGLRASRDDTDSVLYDSQGRELSRGVVHMPTLEPGDYALVVSVAAAGEPVTVQPVLVGLIPPTDGPPETVIRDYLRQAGLVTE